MATVDANHLASDDSAIEAWIDRTGIRHVKVRPLIFREVKEGGRIISGDRPRPHQHTPTTDKTSRRQPGPEEAKTWARDFRRQRARADASATLPPEIRDEVAAHLRSAAPDQTADLSLLMSRAAEEPAPLATLILKTAVVEHEVADHKNEPVGNDIVTCLRKVIDSLQESHETHTEEGLTRVLHVLADLEQCILERLQELAGGTDEDAEVVRTGARAIEHDVKGDALKREYEQKRSALQDVERRVKQFFEADPH